MDLKESDEVLVPSLHCGSVIESLRRTGAKCVFYELNNDWIPDKDELDKLISPRTHCLYLIHYLGFPIAVNFWREWCNEKKIFLIEDCAHCWPSPSSPVGFLGDISIFCPYKFFGLPPVSLLINMQKARVNNSGQSILFAKRLISTYLLGLKNQRPFLNKRSIHEDHNISFELQKETRTDFIQNINLNFELGDPYSTPPSWAIKLVRILDRLSVFESRRRNYLTLLSYFFDLVPPPFRKLPEDLVPFAFPIQHPNAPSVVDKLHAEGIIAMRLWPVAHPLLDANEVQNSKRIRETTICLPINQNLSSSDLYRIKSAVERILNNDL